MMREINEFLGEDEQDLEEGVENMEIDQQKRDLERSRNLDVAEQNNNAGNNQNNQASSSLTPIQNMEQRAQASGASTSGNFNMNRSIPQFLQPSDASRNRPIALTQSGSSQSNVFQVNTAGSLNPPASNGQNQAPVPQVIRNRSSSQPGLPQDNNGLGAQHNVGQQDNIMGNGAQIVPRSIPGMQSLMQYNPNNQQGGFVGANPFPNVGQLRNEGGQHVHQGFAALGQANPVNAPQVGINRANNQANIATVQSQGNPSLHAELQNVNAPQQGVLLARNTNRLARRTTPYSHNANQIRRQNFDNLANLLWSLSKKFSYVRNPDQDNDENDPVL